MVTVPVLHTGPSPRSQAGWAIDGERWTLNGEPTDVWGIRVASGSQTQALTDELIAAMPDYVAHGINAIAVFYQGSRGLFTDPFQNPAGDTVTLDAGHQDRMDQIIDAAETLGMLVVVGLFYQNVTTYNLSSLEQVRNALRLVTQLMAGRTNVIIDPCNEQNHTPNWDVFETATGWDWNSTARVIEACQIVHTENPAQLAGGGGFSPANNEVIVASPDVDALLFDTGAGWTSDSSAEADDYELAWNTPKPLLNIETYGGITRVAAEGGQLNDIGVFFHGAIDRRPDYTAEVDRAALKASLGMCFHGGNWTQVVSGGGANIHFELGTPGDGTAANPGIRWWFEHVRDNT